MGSRAIRSQDSVPEKKVITKKGAKIREKSDEKQKQNRNISY